MARTPDNEFTRMIVRVSDSNRGVGRVESPVLDAGDLPLSRSAAVGQAPLSVEERAELDALAASVGITNQSEEEAGGAYTTRAEAEAAGAPVQREVPLSTYRLDPRVTATEFIARRNMEGFPRLPDFAKPGIIDTIRGVIYLDGLEFPIPEVEVAEFRAYIITRVHGILTEQLTAAMALYTAPAKETPDGGTPAGEEAVQPVPEGEASGGVQRQTEE